MNLRGMINGIVFLMAVLAVVACVGVAIVGAGSWKLQFLGISTREMPVPLLLCIGAAAGLAAGWVGTMLARPGSERIGIAVAPMACAVLSAAVAARLDGIPFIQALISILLGLGGFVASWHAALSIARGDAFGAESHWGGLGNGMGGWRLTPAASSALLASLLFCGSVACATFPAAGRGEPASAASGGVKPTVAASGPER